MALDPTDRARAVSLGTLFSLLLMLLLLPALLSHAQQTAPQNAGAQNARPPTSAAPVKKAATQPRVRTITAFIRLDRAQYREQIAETVTFLQYAKAAFENGGFEVQTIRITTQPFPEYTDGLSAKQVLDFFHEFDRLAARDGFIAAIGPARLADSDLAAQSELLAHILATTSAINGSIVIADDDGVRWNSVRAAGEVIKYLSEHTPHSQGNFRFSGTAMLPQAGPFYPGSYYTGVGNQFAIGLESANVVAEALGTSHDPVVARRAIEKMLGAYVSEVDTIGHQLATEKRWLFGGIDLSPAPLNDVSIGAAIERFTGARMGSSGTLTAAALITQALRAIPVGHVGYSGLMLPILEDAVLSRRWSEGALSIDALLAYSSVCGTGLDVIPLPGAVTTDQLDRILGDVATLAVKWHKPLSARLLPVAGKKAGDHTDFDGPYLVNAVLQPLP